MVVLPFAARLSTRELLPATWANATFVIVAAMAAAVSKLSICFIPRPPDRFLVDLIFRFFCFDRSEFAIAFRCCQPWGRLEVFNDASRFRPSPSGLSAPQIQ